MGNRSFAKRRQERRERVVERIQFLVNKMCRADISENARSHATRERSALAWMLEEMDRLDEIAAVLSATTDNDEAIDQIVAIIESRERPTDEDRERTPQLARAYSDAL